MADSAWSRSASTSTCAMFPRRPARSKSYHIATKKRGRRAWGSDSGTILKSLRSLGVDGFTLQIFLACRSRPSRFTTIVKFEFLPPPRLGQIQIQIAASLPSPPSTASPARPVPICRRPIVAGIAAILLLLPPGETAFHSGEESRALLRGAAFHACRRNPVHQPRAWRAEGHDADSAPGNACGKRNCLHPSCPSDSVPPISAARQYWYQDFGDEACLTG